MATNINVTGPVNKLGYGYVTLNILKSLAEESKSVSWWPIGQVEADPEYHELLKTCLQNRNFFDHNSPSLRIFHQFDLAQHVGSGKRVCLVFFELDRLKPIERHQLNTQDLILVPSEWAKKVCIESGVTQPIAVIHMGVDSDLFKFTEMPKHKNTVFLNMGKWEYRKGHDMLLRAFEMAFNKDDNVELLMCCDNNSHPKPQEYNQGWRDYYNSSPLSSKIKIIDRLKTQQDVFSLMSSVHCGIFPSRGEGWNMEILEMMACGRHIITTNYSAHTEFCNNENSLLVEIEELEDAMDGIWFNSVDECWNNKPGRWAKINYDIVLEISERMRVVHAMNQDGKLSVNRNGRFTAENLTWKNTAQQILKAIDAIPC